MSKNSISLKAESVIGAPLAWSGEALTNNLPVGYLCNHDEWKSYLQFQFEFHGGYSSEKIIDEVRGDREAAPPAQGSDHLTSHCPSPKIFRCHFFWQQSKNSHGVAVASDTDPCGTRQARYQRRDLFRQPSANRIDDANRRCAGMKPTVRIAPAWRKPVASPVCLSQESRGFDLRDNKICNPGSDHASELH